MYWNYREKIFGASGCVLCRETVFISECLLLEISMYLSVQCTEELQITDAPWTSTKTRCQAVKT